MRGPIVALSQLFVTAANEPASDCRGGRDSEEEAELTENEQWLDVDANPFHCQPSKSTDSNVIWFQRPSAVKCNRAVRALA